jgi:hypothetical protein
MGLEPGYDPAELADHRWLLLICQHIDIGDANGGINGHIDLVVTGAIGVTLFRGHQ